MYNLKELYKESDMKAVNGYITKLMITAIVLSVMFVAGIPMIIVGATKSIPAVLGIGIAFTAVGFYGTPLAWTMYGSSRVLARIVYAVTEEHLYTVQEIAAQLSLSEKEVRAHLDKCFNKNFLPGYKRNGDTILLNENIAAANKEMSAECPYCGAKFTYTAQNARCPYCNSPVKK